MKTKVLFVDDEANVLSGLRRMLRSQRQVWDMQFANGGAAALELMANQSFDVVVSDMRMPGVDGAELLNRVNDLFPDTVRLVLSGQSEHEKIFRAIGPAHQFLSKPCEPNILIETIERACGLKNHLTNVELKRLTSRLTELPSLPDTYRELVAELESDEASLKRVSDKIGSDVGMSAKVLQLVNSSFFGLAKRVESPQHAVSLLGLDILRPLVLSAHAFSHFDELEVPGFSQQALVDHSLAVATIAKRIADSRTTNIEIVNDSFIAGLMHDVGKLVLAANLPTEFSHAIQLAIDENLPLIEAEIQVFESTHAEVGGHLLGLWGIPNPIVEAVTFHHRPSAAAPSDFSPLAAVHVANVLGQSVQSSESVQVLPSFDEPFMNQLGLPLQNEEWNAIVNESPDALEAQKS